MGFYGENLCIFVVCFLRERRRTENELEAGNANKRNRAACDLDRPARSEASTERAML